MMAGTGEGLPARPRRATQIECLFNPAELTITKSNTWQAPENKGGNAPELRFQAGQPGTLTLSA